MLLLLLLQPKVGFQATCSPQLRHIASRVDYFQTLVHSLPKTSRITKGPSPMLLPVPQLYPILGKLLANHVGRTVCLFVRAPGLLKEASILPPHTESCTGCVLTSRFPWVVSCFPVTVFVTAKTHSVLVYLEQSMPRYSDSFYFLSQKVAPCNPSCLNSRHCSLGVPLPSLPVS